jgi:thiol-disulfide isomerase/thioredoxin
MSKSITGLITYIIAYIFHFPTIAQDTARVVFDEKLHVLKQGGVVALYRITSDSFTYNGISYQVKLPEDVNLKELGLAIDFYGGWKSPKIPNSTMLLVNNYKSAPELIVDANQDLDFSDSTTLRLANADNEWKLYLPNNRGYSARTYREVRFVQFSDEKAKEIVVSMLSNDQRLTGANILDSQYWLESRTVNYRTATTTIEGVPVLLGLVDGSGNGKYNDQIRDLVLVGDSETGQLSDDFSNGAYPLENELKIAINDQSFKVINVSPQGDYVLITKEAAVDLQLKPGSVIPNYTFESLEGEKITLHPLLNNEFTLLYFWGTWCKPCIEKLPQLKALLNQNEQLDAISFDSHDNLSKAKEFIKAQSISWTQAVSNDTVLKGLFVQTFPTYVLVNKSKQIVGFNLSLDEVDDIVNDR